MNILDIAGKKIVLLDGAMGTSIHALNLPEEAWDGRPGCLEVLNLTVPGKIKAIHRSFFEAGSDIVETNTFGATPVVLSEYGLAGRTEEINIKAARLARECALEQSTPDCPRFVAGSIGPGTKLAVLGQIGFDALYAGYSRQIEGLLEGGVDLLLIETCQDLLQVKAAVAAARDAAKTRAVPIYVSVTVEQTGALLTGTDITGVVAALAPFEIDVLGMNCATGPARMRPHLEALTSRWPGLVGLYPNAGIPAPSPEGVRFPEQPDVFAQTIGRFVREMPINFVGGCCGTTPEHIRRLAEAIRGASPLPKRIDPPRAIASLFSAVEIRQDPPPLYFGERANATGSKVFRDALLAGNLDAAFDVLAEQEEQGSHAADLSVAYAGLDELPLMEILVSRAARECRLPLMIDSNIPAVTEAALKRYPGRAVVNSINLEDGGARAKIICATARRYGAALVGLTIDEQGMAMTAERKIAVAERIVRLCVEEHGLRPWDLFIDPLTFTIGSGDATLRTAAMETIEALRRIKAEIPGVATLLGLSNVSFGLSAKSRRVLNSVFLDLCLKAGLDAAILNPRQIVALPNLDGADIERALTLIENRGDDPLTDFIRHFSGRPDEDEDRAQPDLSPEEAVREGVIKGKTRLIEDGIGLLLGERSAEDILNGILVPAMKRVGDLFAVGALQLPFVLKSAEAMKRAVDRIRPHFAAAGPSVAAKKLLLATVRGDVHDIGKNLVGIIVGNNGFDVIDIGTKAPVDAIISEARRTGVDAIGMSGLLVSSAVVMGENLRAMAEAGLSVPVLVGGAALTPDFVRGALEPAYPTGSVTYCRDAFAGLVAMQRIARGKPIEAPARPTTVAAPSDSLESGPMVIEKIPPPVPPFYGSRIIDKIPLDSVFDFVGETTLFRARWGYRRGEMSEAEYETFIEREVRPKYVELRRIVKMEKLFSLRIAYGYFRCKSEGDALIVAHEDGEIRFEFPRRAREPKICIADFFRADEDVAGFFVVTLGAAPAERGREILAVSGYLNYFLLHGLAVEATDALAEYAHELMRHELGIGENPRLDPQERTRQKYRGGRYAFGYPPCPDLSDNIDVFRLVRPERIGVRLSETFQMIPEFSTSALVAHHPKAKYFTV